MHRNHLVFDASAGWPPHRSMPRPAYSPSITETTRGRGAYVPEVFAAFVPVGARLETHDPPRSRADQSFARLGMSGCNQFEAAQRFVGPFS